MLILQEIKIQSPVPVWWISESKGSYFPVWPSLELSPSRHEVNIQASWHVPGFGGDSARGWPPLPVICYLPPSENMRHWEPHSRDQGASARPETPERERREREHHKGQWIHPSLCLGFSSPLVECTVLYEVGRPAKGQTHLKASLEKEYLLKIFKEAGQEKKAGKGGSGSALSKENVWTEWGCNVGEKWADLRMDLCLTLYTNINKMDCKPKNKS